MKSVNFRMEPKTLELLDKLKVNLGHSGRSATVRFLIHNTSGRKDVSTSVDINTLLLSASMIFGVGILAESPYLQLVSIPILVIVGISLIKQYQTNHKVFSV